jgi:hypothetical protein
MKKTFTTLFAALLITSLAFATTGKPVPSDPVTAAPGMPGQIETQSKVFVVDGIVLDKLDSNTAVIETKFGYIGAQFSGSTPPATDAEVYGFGEFAGLAKWKGLDLRTYKLSKYTID